jgi:hypothetical protein
VKPTAPMTMPVWIQVPPREATTITVAIAPGPASSGIASGTMATSSFW